MHQVGAGGIGGAHAAVHRHHVAGKQLGLEQDARAGDLRPGLARRQRVAQQGHRLVGQGQEHLHVDMAGLVALGRAHVAQQLQRRQAVGGGRQPRQRRQAGIHLQRGSPDRRTGAVQQQLAATAGRACIQRGPHRCAHARRWPVQPAQLQAVGVDRRRAALGDAPGLGAQRRGALRVELAVGTRLLPGHQALVDHARHLRQVPCS